MPYNPYAKSGPKAKGSSEPRPAPVDFIAPIDTRPLADATLATKSTVLYHFDKVNEILDIFTLRNIRNFVTEQVQPPADFEGNVANYCPSDYQIQYIIENLELVINTFVREYFSGVHDQALSITAKTKTKQSYLTHIITEVNSIILDVSPKRSFEVFTGPLEEKTLKGLQAYGAKCAKGDSDDGFGNYGSHCHRTLPLLREYTPLSEGGSSPFKVFTKEELLTLRGAMHQLFDKCNHSVRLACLLNFHSCGRAGESAFCSYDQMSWEATFNCVTAGWFQSKTSACLPTTWVPDFLSPGLCVYNAFGCYWMMCGGLDRPQSQDRVVRFHTNKIFGRKNMGCQEINRALKTVTPDGRTYNVTSNSVRRGSQTTMANCSDLTFDEALARGGWSTGIRWDNYTEWFVRTLMPSAFALAGYTNIRMKKAVQPSVECLPYARQEQMARYVELLFPNQFPQFMPGERLYPFKMAAFAKVLMDFNAMYSRCSLEHPALRHMVSLLTLRGNSVLLPHENPLDVLRECSHEIKKDFYQ